MTARRVRALLALIAASAVATAAILAPHAEAVPGQCSYGSGGGFGGGGFCDGPPRADGSWYHCETVYVLGFGGSNCFFVRPVPLDVDPRGWSPA